MPRLASPIRGEGPTALHGSTDCQDYPVFRSTGCAAGLSAFTHRAAQKWLTAGPFPLGAAASDLTSIPH
jgi:hypothetical protein